MLMGLLMISTHCIGLCDTGGGTRQVMALPPWDVDRSRKVGKLEAHDEAVVRILKNREQDIVSRGILEGLSVVGAQE